MGVPAFFRWLSRKYPSVIIECVENKKFNTDTEKYDYECSKKPNPNGIEFDNLYLDMNGIIHPCTHPEDKPPPKDEDEMMLAIFECIDRLFSIVRPRKLLYMAIDGVAPRAKMNQQRSRRFRSAKEVVEKQQEIERIREDLLSRGCILPPRKENEEHFDSNCITPGTPFMDRLSKCLHYYIHDRLNNNPGWKGIKVILSDANVPGEGEHKIMDFIRKQRAQPDHDPNTEHVLCGADADLMMLGLATHEPHFTIIREEFLPNKPHPCAVCGEVGHEMEKCNGLNSDGGSGSSADKKNDTMLGSEVKFIFVRLCVIREYLRKTLEMPNLPFKYDFERVIDDWVFMCFFVGNDFLPHLPSLEIREGAIDRLVELYKKCVYRTGGYLTNSGEVDLDRVQIIMTDLGNVEDKIFKERQRRELQYRAREKAKRRSEPSRQPNYSILNDSKAFGARPVKAQPVMITNYKSEAAKLRNCMAASTSGPHRRHSSPIDRRQRGLKRTASQAKLNDEQGDYKIERKDEQCANHHKDQRHTDDGGAAAVDNDDDDEQDKVCDEVRLWESGFKDRYYQSKFDVTPDNLEFRYSVALQYVRGLCWVLKYYYQGCPSWKWYFPYHYAPFASDFVNISGLSTSFEKGTQPFNPLEQLMGVFPAASKAHVPKPWGELMCDPNSPIIDFYPQDFRIDLNGKKFAWQGVALLPFVDEERLFKALKPYYSKLTEDEKRRNIRGESRLYISSENRNKANLRTHLKYLKKDDDEAPIMMDGMRGVILQSHEMVPLSETLKSPIRGLRDLHGNGVITVSYRDPIYDEDYIFSATRLSNAIDPPNILAPDNKPDNYRPKIGFNASLPRASLDISGHRMINHYNNDSSYGQQANNSFDYYKGYNNNNATQQQQQQGQSSFNAFRSGSSHHGIQGGGNYRGGNRGSQGGGNYGQRGGKHHNSNYTNWASNGRNAFASGWQEGRNSGGGGGGGGGYAGYQGYQNPNPNPNSNPNVPHNWVYNPRESKGNRNYNAKNYNRF